MTFQTVLNEIQQKNYAVVPIDLTTEELTCAAQLFLDFLTLPLEIKEQFFFKVDEESHRTNVGYTRRHTDRGNADNKEYFHYHALSQQKFSELMKKSDPRVRNFLTAAEVVFQKTSTAFSNFLTVLEEGVPGIHDTFFASHEFPSFYLRFLKYDVRGLGTFLARGHYDTGAMTFALAESAPGLRIGKHDKDLQEVPLRASGTALFMPAMRCKDLHEGLANFTPAWHDVIQKSEDTHSDDVARWAIVFFADPSPINRISTIDAHIPKYGD